jgi:hypothetical protein
MLPADHRRRTRAACLAVAPVLLLGSHLLQPSHGTATASEVAAQASHAGSFRASTLVGLLAVIALVPAVAGLASLLAGRKAGAIGGALAHAGAMGLCFLLGTGAAATVIASEGGSQAVALTEALEGDAAFGVGVGVMLVGWTFGLITLAVALGRARLVPWWGAVALGLAPVVPAVAGGKAPVAFGFVLLLVGFLAAARALVATTDPEAAVPRSVVTA